MDTSRRLDRPAAATLTRRFARAGYPTHEVVAELVTEVAMGRAPLYAASGSVAPQDSEPVTRSVVLHEPSRPVLPIPSRPRWCWSTAMLFIRVGHLFPPVTHGMVATWSQLRAAVARPDVWQQVVLVACWLQSTRFSIRCSALGSHRGRPDSPLGIPEGCVAFCQPAAG
jgi:hypothetical protein